MNTMNNNAIVNKMQELAGHWVDLFQFDTRPALDLLFGSTAADQLTINGIVLCPLADVDVESATCDVEFLYIPTFSGDEFEVYLDCPYEGRCQIGHIKRTSLVYCAAS